MVIFAAMLAIVATLFMRADHEIQAHVYLPDVKDGTVPTANGL
jgi:hypothetical protein